MSWVFYLHFDIITLRTDYWTSVCFLTVSPADIYTFLFDHAFHLPSTTLDNPVRLVSHHLANMRLLIALACTLAAIFHVAIALPHHDRTARGPIDLSGLTGPGGMSFICIFPPCPVQPIVLPPIDWEALLASLAELNLQQLSLTPTDA